MIPRRLHSGIRVEFNFVTLQQARWRCFGHVFGLCSMRYEQLGRSADYQREGVTCDV